MNKKLLVIVLLWTLTLIGCSSIENVKINVNKGVMDATDYEFADHVVIPLDGEWEFYWNQLLTPSDFTDMEWNNSQDVLMRYRNVPGSWMAVTEMGGHFDEGTNVVTSRGYSTYRMKIVVPVDEENRLFGIKTSMIRVDTRMFINGKLMLENGKFSLKSNTYKPGGTPQAVYFYNDQQEIEIIIQVNNDYRKNPGINRSIYLGTEKAISTKALSMHEVDLLFFIVLIILFVISLVYFVITVKYGYFNYYYLLLGVNCLILSIIHAGYREKLLYQWMNTFSTETVLRIGDSVVPLYFLVNVVAIVALYKGLRKKLIPRFTLLYLVIYLSVVLFVPMIYYAPYVDIFYSMGALVIITFSCYYYWYCKRYKEYEFQCRNNTDEKLIFDHRILISFILFPVLYGVNIRLFHLAIIDSNLVANTSLLIYITLMIYIIADKSGSQRRDIVNLSHRLQKLDELKDEFLANTTHELQTPLNGIINMTESILEDLQDRLTDKDRAKIAIISMTGKRLSLLVNDILDISRLKRQDLHLDLKSIMIQPSIKMTCEVLERSFKENNITVDITLPDEIPPVYVDENRFRQIIYNVVGNAIKYTENGKLKIFVNVYSDFIDIKFEDTGIGIADDKKEVIFKSFEQVSGDDARLYGGMGLGLSISRKLAESMGGTLTLQWSEVGKGSCFSLKLPKSKEPVLPNKTGHDTALVNTPVVASRMENIDMQQEIGRVGSDFTILVVDDDVVNLQVIISFLQKENCSIITAMNGEIALEIVKGERKIDLVILDIMMPKLSGYEVSRQLREVYSHIELPILMTTAKNQPEEVVLGFAAGANDYIIKPFNATVLQARVRIWIRMKTLVEEVLSNEMAFLQSQIKPHFLFNAMSTIISFCYTDGEKAGQLLKNLSDYLRRSFDFDNRSDYVTIQQELALTRAYTEIEKARFGERFHLEFFIDDEVIYNKILPLTIQPLVENAIRHGIIGKESGGTVQIRIEKIEKDRIQVTIEDDGVGMEDTVLKDIFTASTSNKSVGLRNINGRLLKCYNEQLVITSTLHKGTKIRFTIPIGVA